MIKLVILSNATKMGSIVNIEVVFSTVTIIQLFCNVLHSKSLLR